VQSSRNPPHEPVVIPKLARDRFLRGASYHDSFLVARRLNPFGAYDLSRPVEKIEPVSPHTRRPRGESFVQLFRGCNELQKVTCPEKRSWVWVLARTRGPRLLCGQLPRRG